MTKNFVFSSVGDNTHFDSLWINNNMDYDLYVIYYGSDETIYEKYKLKVTYIEKRKGSKFQNFKYFYVNNSNIIDKYDRFFILDDDIIFNVNDINNMFRISRKYNLDICGPSFSKKGKISHKYINTHKPNILLQYTNFVEVNTPLFNKKSLTSLMKILDYSLIGWGIDMLYIQCNGLEKEKSYAIIHKIKCINPHDHQKDNKRELAKIKNCDKREDIWKKYAKRLNFQKCFIKKKYSFIKL
jgi:hypothetical protein